MNLFLKKITNLHIGPKNVILRKTWKQMYSFNLYDRFANFRDCSKAWQMKLKLWHLILQEIVRISSGRKDQTFCHCFATVFNFFPAKLGALPILQECPSSIRIKYHILPHDPQPHGQPYYVYLGSLLQEIQTHWTLLDQTFACTLWDEIPSEKVSYEHTIQLHSIRRGVSVSCLKYSLNQEDEYSTRRRSKQENFSSKFRRASKQQAHRKEAWKDKESWDWDYKLLKRTQIH